MRDKMNTLDRLAARPRRLFLLDGLGALLTGGLLVGLLASMEPAFGMPRATLYPLALIAAVFAAYSLTMAIVAGRNWRPLLRGIAVANLLYCGLTAALVVLHWDVMTPLGIAYFAGESGIVGCLVAVEWSVARLGKRGEAA